MTKRNAVISAVISVSFVIGSSGQAQVNFNLVKDKVRSTVQNEIVEAGVLPDSLIYWADIFGEELRFVFTFNSKKRADYLLEKDKERLEELKALSAKSRTKYGDKIAKEREKKLLYAEKLYAKYGEKIDQNSLRELTKVQVEETKQTESESALEKKFTKVKQTINDFFKDLFAKTQDNLQDKADKIREFEESEKNLQEE